MKKITLMLFFAICFGASQLVSAQKLAHVSSLELLDLMPEKKKADEELKTLADQKRTELEKQEKAIKDKYELYQKEAPSKSEAENQKRGEEVQKLAENLNTLRDGAARELEEKQRTKYEPIYKKAQDAINDVSKSKGFEYVFDSSQPGILYLGGQNIIDDVKKKLGLK